jgi:hypothetical protein
LPAFCGKAFFLILILVSQKIGYLVSHQSTLFRFSIKNQMKSSHKKVTLTSRHKARSNLFTYNLDAAVHSPRTSSAYSLSYLLAGQTLLHERVDFLFRRR